MNPVLNVYDLPGRVTPEELAGGTAVVIDVLRASTTICHALEAGARAVLPCLEVAEARAKAAELPPGEAVLGGERGGLPIEGFDLGNSPSEYTAEAVGGRTVVFTTTNGTRAMDRCRKAERVLVGGFVNARAVCDVLLDGRDIHLVCAGTRGEPGLDDLLLAGLLAARLGRSAGESYRLNDRAAAARESWLSRFPPAGDHLDLPDAEKLAAVLETSPGGRNLLAIGLAADIRTAARIDRFRTAAELDTRAWRIRSA